MGDYVRRYWIDPYPRSTLDGTYNICLLINLMSLFRKLTLHIFVCIFPHFGFENLAECISEDRITDAVQEEVDLIK